MLSRQRALVVFSLTACLFLVERHRQGFHGMKSANGSNLNPTFGSDFDVDFTQPLWRGLIRTTTDRQLKLINPGAKISERQFRQRVAEIVQQLHNQYWELVFAIGNHETRGQSVELTLIQGSRESAAHPDRCSRSH